MAEEQLALFNFDEADGYPLTYLGDEMYWRDVAKARRATERQERNQS